VGGCARGGGVGKAYEPSHYLLGHLGCFADNETMLALGQGL